MNTATLSLFYPKHLIIGLAMLLAAGLAVALTPKTKIADQGPRIDLEAMIPKQFGDWRVDESIVPIQVSPDVQAVLDRIYNQTLSRTYVNSQGQRIMLSIAYGGDQSDSMQVHKPEVCYPAQGFQILQQADGTLDTGYGVIPIRKLVAQNGNRYEPITYWMTIGDKVAQGTRRKMEQIRFGLTGKIPDGLLFRVSSISGDAENAYRVQQEFSRDLLAAVNTETRHRLIGSVTEQGS